MATLGVALVTLAAASANALEGGPPSSEIGEIDANVHFTGAFGDLRPSEQQSTWQAADVRVLELGVGYNAGAVGPLEDFYVRVEGAYFTSAEESVQRVDDALPRGHRFFPADKGGWVTALVSSNLVTRPRWSFGLFAQGTVPLNVDLDKYSSPRLHYVGGGSSLHVRLTDPSGLAWLALDSRLLLGAGAWDGDAQQNAALASTTLLTIEFDRWVLPWRVGVRVGPRLEADLNAHTNESYHQAYAQAEPSLLVAEAVRSMRLDLALLPFIEITRHAVIELGFTQTLVGYHLQATQRWTGGLRSRF